MREAGAYAKNGIPVYLYSFDHVPSTPVFEEELRRYDLFGSIQTVKFTRQLRFESVCKLGYLEKLFQSLAFLSEAFHGLDHAYIFADGYANNFEFKFTKREAKFSSVLCELLTNFVKYQ